MLLESDSERIVTTPQKYSGLLVKGEERARLTPNGRTNNLIHDAA